MKTLFKINLILIIINILLIPITILSLLFISFYLFWIPFGIWVLSIIFTGLIQVLTYITYLFKWSEIYDTLKLPFKIYGIITAITIVIFIMDISHIRDITHYSDMPHYLHIIFTSAFLVFELSNSIIIVLAALLALFFIYLSKRQYDFYNSNINTDELLNS